MGSKTAAPSSSDFLGRSRRIDSSFIRHNKDSELDQLDWIILGALCDWSQS